MYSCGVPVARTPGQRAGLTGDHVLAAARGLLAEGGLAALTMRALAARLGVRPNALYSHVAGKTALVDALLDDVLGEVAVPAPDTPDPLAGVEAVMTSTYAVLLAHAELVPAFLARQGARGPNAVRLGEVVVGLLARAGVTGPRAVEALQVLIVHAIGSAAFATRPPFAAGPDPAPAAGDPDARFERGLRWILAGVTAGEG